VWRRKKRFLARQTRGKEADLLDWLSSPGHKAIN